MVAAVAKVVEGNQCPPDLCVREWQCSAEAQLVARSEGRRRWLARGEPGEPT